MNTTTGTVAVAVDGSDSSRAALSWAADDARAVVHPELHAIHILSGDGAVPVRLAVGLLGTPRALLPQARRRLGRHGTGGRRGDQPGRRYRS